MWRVINFRAFLLTAVCCITVILSLCLFPPSAYIPILIILITALITMAVISIFARDAVKAIAYFLSIAVCIALIVNTSITLSSWVNELENSTEYVFKGKIERVDDGGYILSGVSANDEKLDGKFYLSVTKNDGYTINFLKPGDTVSFSTADYYFNEIADSVPNGYIYRNDLRYSATIDESEVEFVSDDSDFLDALRNSITTALNDNMGEYGAVALGMITGEKGGIDENTVNAYSAVGIGHILAVSGLHIGFLVLIINWIMDRLKAGKILRLSVSIPVLFFYCALSFFSPSAIRASIMCVVGIVASLFGERRDMLNSLSLAFTLILCFKPLYLFDAGFIMSVTAVLGIILFNNGIDKALEKLLPNKISSAIALSVSAQIGITPVMLVVFNSMTVYSVITNLIVIPLVSLSFTLILVTLVLVLIFPMLGIALSIVGVLLSLVDTIAVFISYLPFADLRIFAEPWFYFSYIALFILSRFFMLPKFKWIVTAVLITGVCLAVGISNIPLSREYDYITYSSYREVTSILRVDGKTLIVGDIKSYGKIDGVMRSAKERRIDGVLVHTLTSETVSVIVKLNEKYPVNCVYCPEGNAFPALQSLVSKDIEFRTINGIDNSVFGITVVKHDGDYIGYGYKSGSASILMTGYGTNTKKLPVSVINEYAIIRSYTYGGEYSKRIYLTNYENSYLSEKPEKEYTVDKSGMALMLKSGKIKVF